ncbi:MAG: histidine phosphatase family protein [Patescibacteria group bacterium]|nr:histidine phosphatase family protein [Patescibacteria group bacterium]
MRVYLIRHGQSQARVTGNRQGPKTPLSEEGVLQSRKVAEVLAKFELSLILSSPWERALQTAKIISDVIRLPVEVVNYIHERKLHPNLYYASLDSDINRSYVEKLHANYTDFNWKFKGKGESVAQVYKRAMRFKKHILKNYRSENILVVTHGVFLFCFIMVAILDNKFDEKMLMKLLTQFVYTNTGISLLEYEKETNKWRLKYFNDINHLGGG